MLNVRRNSVGHHFTGLAAAGTPRYKCIHVSVPVLYLSNFIWEGGGLFNLCTGPKAVQSQIAPPLIGI